MQLCRVCRSLTSATKATGIFHQACRKAVPVAHLGSPGHRATFAFRAPLGASVAMDRNIDDPVEKVEAGRTFATFEGNGGQPSSSAAAATVTDGTAEQRGQKRKSGNQQPQQKKLVDPRKVKVGKLQSVIAQHAKYNRLLPAIEAFQEAIVEDLPIGAGLFNTLLYLTCGGNNWEAYARGKPVPANEADDSGLCPPTPSKDELVASAATIWAHMQRFGVAPDNVTYLSLARIEAIKGNAEGAWQWAKMSAAANHPVQLRLYHPALVSYTLAGDAASVVAIDAEIAAYGKEQLDLTEYEYALLLEALTLHGSWTQVAGVFRRIGEELNQLSPPTLALIEAYFSGPRAVEAFGAQSQQERELQEQQREQRLLQLRQRQQEEAEVQRVQREEREAATRLRHQQLREGQGQWYTGPPTTAAREVPAKRRSPTAAATSAEDSGMVGLSAADAAPAGTASPLRRARSPTKARSSSPVVAASGLEDGELQASSSINASEVAAAAAPAMEAPAVRRRSPRQTGSPSAASPVSDGIIPPSSPMQAATTSGPGGTHQQQADHQAAAIDEAESRRRRPWLSYEGAVQWRVQSGVKVDESGSSQAAGAALQVVDLEEEEWASFASAVAALAMSQEQRKSDFQHYMDWYERNGPYDIMIDGANVAYFGQNREGGGFCWPQIMAMTKLVMEQHPGKKTMLMLHKKRVNDHAAWRPDVREFLDSLKATKSFYYTPPGSNDDWYWLYATVKARASGLLISNDELRDHIWSLLRPKHFLKWKSRHIAHYTFALGDNGMYEPVLIKPQPYTECVQELSNGAWMFPGQDGTWLCARPAAAGEDTTDPMEP